MKRFAFLLALVCALCAGVLFAQNLQPNNPTPIQAVPFYYAVTPIAATGAVNNQVTLTIPAPPGGLYNYVCSLHYNASQNGTATVQTNAVTTSTNFNSYAIKYSLTATATINYDWVENWAPHCAKSASPGTATTFVSPAAGANIAFTWTATYFQAP